MKKESKEGKKRQKSEGKRKKIKKKLGRNEKGNERIIN